MPSTVHQHSTATVSFDRWTDIILYWSGSSDNLYKAGWFVLYSRGREGYSSPNAWWRQNIGSTHFIMGRLKKGKRLSALFHLVVAEGIRPRRRKRACYQLQGHRPAGNWIWNQQYAGIGLTVLGITCPAWLVSLHSLSTLTNKTWNTWYGMMGKQTSIARNGGGTDSQFCCWAYGDGAEASYVSIYSFRMKKLQMENWNLEDRHVWQNV